MINRFRLCGNTLSRLRVNKRCNNYVARRRMGDIPHTPMDARAPMVLVQKNVSVQTLESPWVEEKDPAGDLLHKIIAHNISVLKLS